jgi:thiamine pyrophosphokinase
VRFIIFANGEFPDPQGARELLRPDDHIITADGGTRHALAVGVAPQVIIGDLDSLSPDERARAEAAGSCIIRFSPRKDETDLELALRHAAREGATEIVILAALGGRLDQTIANLLLLALPELSGLDVRVVDGAQTAFLIRGAVPPPDAPIHRGEEGRGQLADRPGRGGHTIVGQPGDTLSLIPLGGDAVGVTAEGVEWPLHEDTLCFGPARGVSNVLAAERAHVRVREGVVLCVVTRAGA